MALHHAARNGNAELLHLMLNDGISVNERDYCGRTPLWLAASKGKASICDILLRYGALVDEFDSDGHTPLWVAASNGHDNICSLLISHGADIFCMDEDIPSPYDTVNVGKQLMFSKWKDMYGNLHCTFFTLTFFNGVF